MPFGLTTNDVLKLYEVAIQRTARCLEIDTAGKNFLQLFGEVETANREMFALLDAFIASYRQYQNFHIQLDLKLFNGQPLSDLDRNILADHINSRDETRNRLISELESRGC